MSRRMSLVMLCVISTGVIVLTPSASSAGGCHVLSEDVRSARAEGDAVVPIEKCGFSPTVIYVEPGANVTWVNRDPVPHTVTGAANSLGADKFLNDGDRITFTFDDVGVYPYSCILHPGMTGAVVVGDVSTDKASADQAETAPVAVDVEDEPLPPAEETVATEETSSYVLPVGLGVGLVLVAIAVGVLVRRRHAGSAPALQ